MRPEHKYARVERERRFLLTEFPGATNAVRVRRIVDRYIDGTALRLREISEENCSAVFKLTQKLPMRGSGAQRGLITTMYLSGDEFSMLAQLPARTLRKARYSVPPFGIDVFAEGLRGLLIAEAEFDSAEAADALELPPFIFREVSEDERFTGGRLAGASREEVEGWLAEYGIAISSG